MQISILCVGKLKEKYWVDASVEYIKRLGRYCRIEVIEVADEKTPDQASERVEEQIKEKEADRLSKYIKENMYVIAMDIQGKQYDSIAFSEKLSNLMLQGKSNIAFVIGGSLGLHVDILRRADERISFSKLTFPHQLMRVILLEQIYRANRILKHEPYHK